MRLSQFAVVAAHLRQANDINSIIFTQQFLPPLSLSLPPFLMQLKVQEAMRKKEKFQREHEEVSANY